MPLKLKIELTEEAKATLRAVQELPQTAMAEIVKAMDLQNQITVGLIKSKYLSFPKQNPPVEMGLRYVSGRYRQSLRASQAVAVGQRVESGIGSSVVSKEGVSYPAVHEFGARIPAHDIYPKNKGALKFQIGERTVFAKVVHHPGSTIPARAPIQSGIEDRIAEYGEAVSNAIVNALKR
jgi:hypothetical protein